MKLLHKTVPDLKPLRNGPCGIVLANVDRHRSRLLDVHQPRRQGSATLGLFLTLLHNFFGECKMLF